MVGRYITRLQLGTLHDRLVSGRRERRDCLHTSDKHRTQDRGAHMGCPCSPTQIAVGLKRDRDVTTLVKFREHGKTRREFEVPGVKRLLRQLQVAQLG